MQWVSSKIWTRVAVSISYDDKHYTTSTSIDISFIFGQKPINSGLCFTYAYVHIALSRWDIATNVCELETHGIMGIIVENGHDDLSLNPGRIYLHSLNTLVKVKNP